MASRYQERIAEAVGGDVDAAHVEAWMRLEYGTLDGLAPAQFDREARVGAELVRANPADSRRLALSYGLGA